MKIINRLYIKVIIIAAILIVASVKLYDIEHKYNQIKTQKTKEINALKQTTQQKINLLEKKIINYKVEVSELKQKIKPTPKPKKIIKKSTNQDKKSEDKYKIIIMQNIHHQILQELKYAPYLPVSQLQTMMQERFVGIKFQISIYTNDKQKFNGMKHSPNKIYSIIRDNELLEVRFDTK